MATDTSTSEVKSTEIEPGEQGPTDGNATPSKEAGRVQTLTQDEKTEPAEEDSETSEAKEKKSIKLQETASAKQKTLSRLEAY